MEPINNNSRLFQIFDDLVTFIMAQKSNAQLQTSVKKTSDENTQQIIAKDFQNIYDYFMQIIAFHDFLNPLKAHMNKPQDLAPLPKIISEQLPVQLSNYTKYFKILHADLQQNQEISQTAIKDIKSDIIQHLNQANSQVPNNYQKINDQNLKIITENLNGVYQNMNDQLESIAVEQEATIKLIADQVKNKQKEILGSALTQINQLLPDLESVSEECNETLDQVSQQTTEVERFQASFDQVDADALAVAPQIQHHKSDIYDLLEDIERQMRDSTYSHTTALGFVAQVANAINYEVSYMNGTYNKSIKSYTKDRNILHKSYQCLFTHSYKDSGVAHASIMMTQQGDAFVGGYDESLYKYSSSLQLTQSTNVGRHIFSGIVIDNKIYCGCLSSLCIFDEDLQLLKEIKTQSIIKKLLVIDDDYLLLGQYHGYIDIINISTSANISHSQLSMKDNHISDIIKTQNKREYAFATYKGLYFGTVSKDFTFTENKHEVYFLDKNVQCLAIAQPHLLFACVQMMTSVQAIDRELKQVVKQIANSPFDGEYSSLQKIIGYDDLQLPFLIIKDAHNITIINTQTFQATPIIQCKYEYMQSYNSMAQSKEGKQTKLLTLYFDDYTKERMIKEFIINED